MTCAIHSYDLIVATHHLTAPKRADLPEARTRKDLP